MAIEALCQFAGDRIARFKILCYLWIVDEFPIAIAGQARKAEICQQAIEDLRGLG